MSWTGGTFDYPVGTDMAEMEADINEQLLYERGFMEPVFQGYVWRRDICLNSREEAEKWLANSANMSRYWRRSNVGIQYISREREMTKKELALAARIEDIQRKREEYVKEHAAANTAHAYIGCPNCGSRLSTKHLRDNRCPLCRAELRSETILSTIKRYDERLEEACKAYTEEKNRPKRGDKVTKMWLINAEAYIG